jgi:hypothetical protein
VAREPRPSRVGVDVAAKGIPGVFAEQQRSATAVRTEPPFTIHATGRSSSGVATSSPSIRKRHGTFSGDLRSRCADRLPDARRTEYARKLVELLAPGGRLLVAMEYDRPGPVRPSR